MRVEVIGVYPVYESEEPCHLVEVVTSGSGVFDVAAITQPDAALYKQTGKSPMTSICYQPMVTQDLRSTARR